MSVAKNIENKIASFPSGMLFTYNEFKGYKSHFSALSKTLDRLSDKGEIERFRKGVYYKPKETVFGMLKPSESEKIKYILSKGGYITGGTIYNKWGISTQVPNEIVIATDKPRKQENLDGLQVRYVKGILPTQKSDIPKLQLLDILKNVKNIPDREDQAFVFILKSKIANYSDKDLKRLIVLAQKYNPATRALLGAILELLEQSIYSGKLKKSLNPLTKYRLLISPKALPNQENWQMI